MVVIAKSSYLLFVQNFELFSCQNLHIYHLHRILSKFILERKGNNLIIAKHLSDKEKGEEITIEKKKTSEKEILILSHKINLTIMTNLKINQSSITTTEKNSSINKF